ncbi:hypothetical protein QTO34_001231 [Cnephaeus nilssonii]|uniref:Uncharacterized protein n=1 Tax=Cnephaeus nilssonii TaxID=3371016 RepID=A0AA40HW91_CNENI|nr:hypothetical protein QTO34_001231 [Eptesicus nilssonii]
MELNLPKDFPIVCELEPIKPTHFLGDEETVCKAVEVLEVAAQGKARNAGSPSQSNKILAARSYSLQVESGKSAYNVKEPKITRVDKLQQDTKRVRYHAFQHINGLADLPFFSKHHGEVFTTGSQQGFVGPEMHVLHD